MTINEKQQQLLANVAKAFYDLAEECEIDEAFHEVIIDNNDLFPMSLDDLAGEWSNVANGERNKRNAEDPEITKVAEMFAEKSANGELEYRAANRMGKFIGSDYFIDGSGELAYIGVYTHRGDNEKVLVTVNEFDEDDLEDGDTGFVVISPDEYGFYEVSTSEVINHVRKIVANSLIDFDLDDDELIAVFAE